MKFSNYIGTPEVCVTERDLIYNKGSGLLGYVKDGDGNIFKPLEQYQRISDLGERALNVTLVNPQLHFGIEKEVAVRWESFADYLIKNSD